jgi:O-antigen/teichoic acid export membrane protein
VRGVLSHLVRGFVLLAVGFFVLFHQLGFWGVAIGLNAVLIALILVWWSRGDW